MKISIKDAASTKKTTSNKSEEQTKTICKELPKKESVKLIKKTNHKMMSGLSPGKKKQRMTEIHNLGKMNRGK